MKSSLPQLTKVNDNLIFKINVANVEYLKQSYEFILDRLFKNMSTQQVKEKMANNYLSYFNYYDNPQQMSDMNKMFNLDNDKLERLIRERILARKYDLISDNEYWPWYTPLFYNLIDNANSHLLINSQQHRTEFFSQLRVLANLYEKRYWLDFDDLKTYLLLIEYSKLQSSNSNEDFKYRLNMLYLFQTDSIQIDSDYFNSTLGEIYYNIRKEVGLFKAFYYLQIFEALIEDILLCFKEFKTPNVISCGIKYRIFSNHGIFRYDYEKPHFDFFDHEDRLTKTYIILSESNLIRKGKLLSEKYHVDVLGNWLRPGYYDISFSEKKVTINIPSSLFRNHGINDFTITKITDEIKELSEKEVTRSTYGSKREKGESAAAYKKQIRKLYRQYLNGGIKGKKGIENIKERFDQKKIFVEFETIQQLVMRQNK